VPFKKAPSLGTIHQNIAIAFQNTLQDNETMPWFQQITQIDLRNSLAYLIKMVYAWRKFSGRKETVYIA
jgi:hypothetical protein